MAQCAGRNKDGSPCSATVKPGERFCIWHDPTKASQRATWQTKGARAANQKRQRINEAVATGDLDGLSALLYDALNRVSKGRLDPTRANAMANLARAILAVHETSNLSAKVEKIQALLESEFEQEASNG